MHLDLDQSADAVIQSLRLLPHPEGGHYRETWRSAEATAILFLLAAGERSHWHRVNAAEIWLWHAGAALTLSLAGKTIVLGPDLAAGEALQGVVAPHAWQAAASRGAWTLVSCVVAPAFTFEGFEMAPAGWEPK